MDEEIYEWEKAMETLYYKTKADFLWQAVLGGCGCGTQPEISDMALYLLDHFAKEIMERDHKTVNNSPHYTEYEIIAHWFDSKGLIEHGGNVMGSWLSDEGRKLHRMLMAKDFEENITQL